MKKRLRKRKKIRGGRAVFRCITDPTDSVTYVQGPDGVFRPLMRTQNVYIDVEEAVKAIQLQAIRVTMDFDDGPGPAREIFEAFELKTLTALRERLPDSIYKTLPAWARLEEEETTGGEA